MSRDLFRVNLRDLLKDPTLDAHARADIADILDRVESDDYANWTDLSELEPIAEPLS